MAQTISVSMTSRAGFFSKLVAYLIDKEKQGWHDKIASTYVVQA